MALRSSERKFLHLLFDVLAYQFAHSDDGELLSQQADRWVYARPVLSRLVIGVGGAVLTLHLGNFVNPRYDVLSKELWGRWL